MKTFVVTGASRGIGYATSLSFTQKEYRVIAVARNKAQLDNLTKTAKNGLIIPIEADISLPADRENIRAAAEQIGGIDGLVNNAAILINKNFLDLTELDWKSLFNVNLFSIVEFIKLLYPHFKTGSHIINIGSLGGFQGTQKFPGLSAYGASKGALSILTESLSVEFDPEHVRINCLALGAVTTEMLKEAFPDFKADTTAEDMGTFIRNFAIKEGLKYNGAILPVTGNNPT